MAGNGQCSRKPTIHGTGKQSVQHPHCLAIKTLFGTLRMWMKAILCGLWNGHCAMRYLAEFQYRFNRRFHLAKLIPPRLLQPCEFRPRLSSSPFAARCRLSFLPNQV